MEQNFKADLKTGTTTVGIIAQDAVVLAADMRATMGHVAYEEESKKLYKVTNYMAVTNAGIVGDSLTIIRFLRSQARLYEIERECRMSVKAAATLLSNVLNANRHFPFMVQLVLGGVNEGPEIYELTPYGGVLERKRYAATGSGTELALATLDQNYNEKMAESEAIKLAVTAVSAAVKRDIYSGGKSIAVMVVDKKGIREVSEKEISKILKPAN